MCRWFAYISKDEILLEDALVNPEHAIVKPPDSKFNEDIALNADGFGVAWYTKTLSRFDIENASGSYPALYRATTGDPLNDTSFLYLSRGSASNVILSHVRDATGAVAMTNNHPFAFGRSSFVHHKEIKKFQEIRPKLLHQIGRRYIKKISGSTDSEHFAAFYFTHLEKEMPTDFFPNIQEKKYEATAMFNALKSAIRDVEKLQNEKLNNTFNICATNGESLVALCYSTIPEETFSPLYVSAVVPDELNRASELYNPKDGQKTNAVERFTADPLIDKSQLGEKPNSIIIATEPVTFDKGSWYKLKNGQAILVDNAQETNKPLTVKVESMI